MEFIHNFWVEMLPMFQNGYEFIYIFFDVATVFSLLVIMFEVPSCLLLGKKGRDLW